MNIMKVVIEMRRRGGLTDSLICRWGCVGGCQEERRRYIYIKRDTGENEFIYILISLLVTLPTDSMYITKFKSSTSNRFTTRYGD